VNLDEAVWLGIHPIRTGVAFPRCKSLIVRKDVKRAIRPIRECFICPLFLSIPDDVAVISGLHSATDNGIIASQQGITLCAIDSDNLTVLLDFDLNHTRFAEIHVMKHTSGPTTPVTYIHQPPWSPHPALCGTLIGTTELRTPWIEPIHRNVAAIIRSELSTPETIPKARVIEYASKRQKGPRNRFDLLRPSQP
jgi:hypothetical protein